MSSRSHRQLRSSKSDLSRFARTIAVVVLILSAVTASSIVSAEAQEARANPEGASGWTKRTKVTAQKFMVVAANAYATTAGRDILRDGGSAVDAAIAVQLVLGLVEPQSSGLGGGAFLLHWHGATKTLVSIDGRETAPARATPDRFMVDGAAMPFDHAVRSGLSVGAPGTVRLMAEAHRRYGRLPWERLFTPAIDLAEDGFLISPRLHALLNAEGAQRFGTGARTYFFAADGMAWPIGHRLRNPAYAATLRRIAREGARAFYEGDIAMAMTTAVIAAPFARGDLSLADLQAYEAKERTPVCVTYRRHRVCGMGPPSSGGVAIGQALMLLEGLPLTGGPGAAQSPRWLHALAETGKLVFADRNHYLADPDHVPIPSGLLDRGYMAERRKLIAFDRAMPRPKPGEPPGIAKHTWADDTTIEAAGTTHISIVDADGNALAMTSTIESGFGSRLWAAGFLLNNQLTDFALTPTGAGGRPLANRVGPGKRPRSSMAPTIVFDEDGEPLLVTGSPGGARIIPYVLQNIVAIIDWNLAPQKAVTLPNVASRGSAIEFETPATGGPWLETPLVKAERWHRALTASIALKPYGHDLAFGPMTSGLHVILRRPDGTLEAGVDPRREGIALGD